MEKTKEFIKKHKKEIVICAGLILAYRLGFKRGCEATDAAVCNLFKEAARTMNITTF